MVQFDTGKTEAVLLTRKHGRVLKGQIQRARMKLGGQLVPFNPEATRWLGVWLDSGLDLKAHYQTCMRKARAAEARVLRLCQSHGLAPGLARQVQVATVQSIALYGAELWWQGQRDQQEGIQLMINRQARAITGMLKTIPVGPLVREAGLIPAKVLLEARQLGYTNRLLKLPEDYPAKKILPWAEGSSRGLWSLGQHLARQLANILPADPSSGFESLLQPTRNCFPGVIKILPSQEALGAAQAIFPGQVIWSDGSRSEKGRTGAGVAWKSPEGVWKTRIFPLGKGYEVFDTELLGVVRALQIEKKVEGQGPVNILLDSQAAIARLQHTQTGPGQALALQAHVAAQELQAQGREPTIQWVPGNAGVEGNERADQAAKMAASRPPGAGPREIFLAFARRARTETIQAKRQEWLTKELNRRPQQARRSYRPHRTWKIDPSAAVAFKHLSSRFFQLKSGMQLLGRLCITFFLNVGKRHQRDKLYKDLEKAGVMKPTAAEDCPEGRLLGKPKATGDLLQFLASISVALPRRHLQREAERTQIDNE
ncbi:ribonuclease H family protein [Aspergillus affinis]|uniref:ribonuclease H family protein n=1 Tax=Aspergillus affinis TaxID=1070780 RepID=UPI0022FE1F88|nr:uncharacterized protein KD926_004984 [Aspergillus affinis]KAI9034952.1 hypothetical protein KD926_004984 [Aspergillus affinis]